MAAGEDCNFAIAVHADDRAFPTAMQASALGKVAAWAGPSFIDECGQANAHQDAVLAKSPLLTAERIVVGKRHELVKQGRRIAGVIDTAAGSRVGEILLCDQVAPAHLDDV